MKKLFCLLLAVTLLASASLALAEDPSVKVREPSEFPNIFFGGGQRKALEIFTNTWKTTFSYSDTPSWKKSRIWLSCMLNSCRSSRTRRLRSTLISC